MSHVLTKRNSIDSEMLLKRNEMGPFLKRVIMGDDKRIKCENNEGSKR